MKMSTFDQLIYQILQMVVFVRYDTRISLATCGFPFVLHSGLKWIFQQNRAPTGAIYLFDPDLCPALLRPLVLKPLAMETLMAIFFEGGNECAFTHKSQI
jgi:hypothetical protein